MDDASLADFEHANMIAAMALIGRNVPGARVRQADGVAVIATGLPFMMFNQVVIEGDEATPAGVEAGVDILREDSGPYVVNLRLGVDDRFVPLMAELGLVRVTADPWMPGMAWHPLPSGEAADHLPGHEIRRVLDTDGLEDHIRTGARGFELPEAMPRAFLTPDVLARDDLPIYVGYTDGEPVSSGLGVRFGRTIGVYNIATLPAFRGRGYGAAITRRVVADGVAAGCDVAVLQASDTGLGVYQRLGFRTVVEYVGYVEPPGHSALG